MHAIMTRAAAIAAALACLIAFQLACPRDLRAGEPAKPDDPLLQKRRELLYRYQREDGNILDGAVFAFVEGNDPEVLLLLEAQRADGGNSDIWRYTLARMTSYQVTARLDGREIFSALPYWKNNRAASDPYAEADDGTFRLDEPDRDKRSRE